MSVESPMCGFSYREYRRSLAIVTDRDRDSLLGAGDLIISVNGKRDNVGAELQNLSYPATLEVVSPLGAKTGISQVVLRSGNVREGGHPALAAFWIATGLEQLARQNMKFCTPAKVEESRRRLLRQRRILAKHLRDALESNRQLFDNLTETQDRLAATATQLGAEKFERFHVTQQLKAEKETVARLDFTVRRLQSRPRAKRTTTHVEIAGLVFRNRTGARV